MFLYNFTNSNSQPSRISISTIIYFIRLSTSFCRLRKHLDWVQCPRVPMQGWACFSFFHWSPQAATSKAEKSEQPLASELASGLTESSSFASGRVVDLKTAYHLSKQLNDFTNSNGQPSRRRIVRKTIYFILRIGEAFRVGSMPSCELKSALKGRPF